MTTVSPIARDSTRGLAFRLSQLVVDALILVVTARGFGADGRGVYALALLTVTFLVIPLLGITTPLSAELAHGRRSLAELNAASVMISLVGGGLVAIVAVAVSYATWPQWPWLACVAIAIPTGALVQCQLALFQARGAVVRFGAMSLAVSISSLVALTVVAIVSPGRINLALLAWAVAQAIVPLAVLATEARTHGLSFTGGRAVLGKLVRRGLPVSLGNAILRLNYRVDIFVVAAMLPLADLGRYSVAVAIGEALWQGSRALITAAFRPIVSSPLAESIAITTRTFKHAMALLLVGSILATAACVVVLGPVLGADFADAWVPLAFLIPGVVGLGSAEVLRVFFLVRLERSREFLYATTGSMVVNLALAIALVPVMGTNGAALATSVAYLVACAVLLARFGSAGGSHNPRDYVPGRSEIRDYVRLVKHLAARTRQRASAGAH